MKYKEVLNVVEIINILIGLILVGGEGMKDLFLKVVVKIFLMLYVIKMLFRI